MLDRYFKLSSHLASCFGFNWLLICFGTYENMVWTSARHKVILMGWAGPCMEARPLVLLLCLNFIVSCTGFVGFYKVYMTCIGKVKCSNNVTKNLVEFWFRWCRV